MLIVSYMLYTHPELKSEYDHKYTASAAAQYKNNNPILRPLSPGYDTKHRIDRCASLRCRSAIPARLDSNMKKKRRQRKAKS